MTLRARRRIATLALVPATAGLLGLGSGTADASPLPLIGPSNGAVGEAGSNGLLGGAVTGASANGGAGASVRNIVAN